MHNSEHVVGIDLFHKSFNDLVSLWKQEYCKNSDTSPDEWPVVRTNSEFLEDFIVWLQCKGYTL